MVTPASPHARNRFPTIHWPSTLALLSALAILILGVWVLYRGDLTWPVRAIRLFVVFLGVGSFVGFTLALGHFTNDRRTTSARSEIANDLATLSLSIDSISRKLLHGPHQHRAQPTGPQSVIKREDQPSTTDPSFGRIQSAKEHRDSPGQLGRGEEHFRLVADTVAAMIWISATDKSCIYVNKPWITFTGRPLGAQLGNGWWNAVHPDDLKDLHQIYTGSSDRRESFTTQYRLRRHDGEYRWIMNIGVPRFTLDGSFAGYIACCTDVTEFRSTQLAMASIGRKLIEAHEAERTWIARELHDDINQRLALLAVELDRLTQNAVLSSAASGQLRHAQEHLEEIANDVQRLSHRLHSSKLEYLGLTTAAKSFCKEFSEEHLVEVDFKESGIPRSLSKDISLCVFRVLQEALQNALKHSGVRRFTVELHGTLHEITLIVTDAGRGFQEQDALSRSGLGLVSMRERLELVQGQLSIRTEPGRGTTVYARAPLQTESEHAKAG